MTIRTLIEVEYRQCGGGIVSLDCLVESSDGTVSFNCEKYAILNNGTCVGYESGVGGGSASIPGKTPGAVVLDIISGCLLADQMNATRKFNQEMFAGHL